jgi:hypothetical protein
MELLSIDGQDRVKKVTLDGAVSMKQQASSLSAEQLVLNFDPNVIPSERPGNAATPDISGLQSIVARGKVLADGLGKEGSLRTEELELTVVDTADGPAISHIRCDRDVELATSSQRMNAEQLKADLEPILLKQGAEPPADVMALVKAMNATGNVTITQADKSQSGADAVSVEMIEGKQTVVLVGKPARASSGSGSLVADRIELDPATGNLRVPAAGQLVGTRTNSAGVVQDSVVSWTGYLVMNSETGVANVSQGVTIKSRDTTGRVVNGTAGRAIIRYTTRPVPTTQPATAGNNLARVQLDEIDSAELIEEVKLHFDAGDSRTAAIEAPEIRFENLSQNIVISKPGRLFVSDLRPSEPGTNSRRGTMALSWNEKLKWNARDGDLLADGDVRVGYERANDPDNLGPIRLAAQQMTGRLRPVDTKSASQTNGTATPIEQGIDLKSLRFDGGVRVRSSRANFDAGFVDFDATTGKALAGSNDSGKVELRNRDGVSRLGFQTLIFDINSGEAEARDVDGRVVR